LINKDGLPLQGGQIAIKQPTSENALQFMVQCIYRLGIWLP